jgi:putative Mg2+ transporter-C (MgtC) family protein
VFDAEPLVADWWIRLLTALAAGALIGLNRDLKHKAAGVRTHALVSLGAGLLVLVGLELGKGDPAGASGGLGRMMQGIITGIGFLGAGVIVRPALGDHVHGLTTAASIWISAGLGVGFASGAWRLTSAAFGLCLLVLLFGGPFERACHRLVDRHGTEPDVRSERPIE